MRTKSWDHKELAKSTPTFLFLCWPKMKKKSEAYSKKLQNCYCPQQPLNVSLLSQHTINKNSPCPQELHQPTAVVDAPLKKVLYFQISIKISLSSKKLIILNYLDKLEQSLPTPVGGQTTLSRNHHCWSLNLDKHKYISIFLEEFRKKMAYAKDLTKNSQINRDVKGIKGIIV